MLKKISLLICVLISVFSGFGQVIPECPPNIGFEEGSFNHWATESGTIDSTGEMFLVPGKPQYNIHTLQKGGIDPYGGFPLQSPDGSGSAIRLGNSSAGRGAERVSYTLTIPSNRTEYSIVLYYAVVLQNPNHSAFEQPKFTAKVIDVSTEQYTECGSFSFTAQSGLPGFSESTLDSSVIYKPWSVVIINLSKYIGHTIRLEFTTNDCTRRIHFGYAYLDINENCNDPLIIGNATCPDATSIELTAPPSFQYYRWFNANDFNQVIGVGERLLLTPAPPVGTRIGVELLPYSGLGCVDTIYTVIENLRLSIRSPVTNCIATGINLDTDVEKATNEPSLKYTYWKDANATIPVSDPTQVRVSGTYYVKGKSAYGCEIMSSVTLILLPGPNLVITDPEPISYPQKVDLSKTFTHLPGVVYTYWADRDAKAKSLRFPTIIYVSGTYYVKAVDTAYYCETIQPVQVVIDIPVIQIPNTFTPNGDGINDVLTVRTNIHLITKLFKIFNRWGDAVFETNDISNYWDGFKNDKTLPIGVYYWIFDAVDEFDPAKRTTRSGSVTLIR